ncbi:MAG: molybdopterin-binding protein, partial [Hyphomicrobiales bacterium]|nr:molybdopterin-binding protein [Hyphomicrobiales bacterium]
MKRNFTIPGVDHDLLAQDAARLMTPVSRRAFLRGSASLGSLVMLTGCNVVDGASAEALLRAVSRFNDHVQAALFNPNRLAREFAEADITRPFPFNAFYPQKDAPEVEASEWQLTVSGLVEDKRPWTLERLNRLA